ncbi:MAG TPA: hypothetical protein VF074_11965 [Pyrinomonadaceae bacterium]
MRNKLGLILLAILLSTSFALGQQSMTAVEKLEKLRLELIDVQGKEENLRARAQQLDEDIKPENIARSLAGVGSTKPDELRESRRRQLELGKKNVLEQLDAVVAKRASLEAEIRTTEIQVYHESAKPTPADINQSFMSHLPGSRSLVIGLAGGVFVLMGSAIFFIRRLRKTR